MVYSHWRTGYLCAPLRIRETPRRGTTLQGYATESYRGGKGALGYLTNVDISTNLDWSRISVLALSVSGRLVSAPP